MRRCKSTGWPRIDVEWEFDLVRRIRSPQPVCGGSLRPALGLFMVTLRGQPPLLLALPLGHAAKIPRLRRIAIRPPRGSDRPSGPGAAGETVRLAPLGAETD